MVEANQMTFKHIQDQLKKKDLFKIKDEKHRKQASAECLRERKPKVSNQKH